MRSNERLLRILTTRQLGGAVRVAACPVDEPVAVSDLRLFMMTFAAGFLFTTIFIA